MLALRVFCVHFLKRFNRSGFLAAAGLSISDKFSGKRVLVMGLGRFGGGVGVSRFFAEHGAKVTVTDTAVEQELRAGLDKLEGLAIEFHLGGHVESDFAESDLIVVNPAVKKNSPWLKIASDYKVPLTAEMNLFFEFCAAPIVGITGSNGKSTTTAMIAEILRAAEGGKAFLDMKRFG